MDDLISRQAVIAEFDCCELTPDGGIDVNYALDIIKALPSAQPEYKLGEWCEDCKEYDKERHCCPRFNRVIRTALSEAEPERKTGKWQITSAYPHNVYCSVCHKKYAQTHWAVWEDGSLPRNFCPNCGAKMEGIE